jgi:hypothetical protein
MSIELHKSWFKPSMGKFIGKSIFEKEEEHNLHPIL